MSKILYVTNAKATTHLGLKAAGINPAYTISWVSLALSELHGSDTGGSMFLSCNSVAGPTSGEESGYQWLSEPLSADFTISGVVTFNIWGKENLTTANMAMNGVIEKVDGVTGAITEICRTARVTELTLSVTALNMPITPPAAVVCHRGDRIRYRFYCVDGGGTMTSGSSANQYYNRSTAAQGETYVQFTENLTFEASPPATPSGSKYYLTDASAGIDPGSATEKLVSTAAGSGQINAILNTPGAAGTWTWPSGSGYQMTDSAGMTAIEWYTPALNATTLAGQSKFNLRGFEPAVSNTFASFNAEIAVCNADGSGAVVWGSAKLVPNTGGGRDGELVTSDTAYTAWVEGANTAIAQGQRLRIRVYVCVAGNAFTTTGVQGGQAITLSYNGAIPTLAGDTYVILPITVTEAPGPKPVKPAGITSTFSVSGAVTVPPGIKPIIPVSPGVSYATRINSLGPYLYWRMDETSGSVAADSSGNGRVGTYVDSPSLGQAPLITADKSVMFDAVSTYLILASGFVNTSLVTVEVWFNYDGVIPGTGANWIAGFCQGDGGGANDKNIALDATGAPYFYIYDGATHYVQSPTPLTVGTHHIVGTYDGVNGNIYVDGVLKASVASGATYTGYSLPNVLVGGTASGVNRKAGRRDEFAVYTRALTPAEILGNYRAGASGGGATATFSVSGVVTKTSFTPKAITPATVNFTNVVSGGIAALRRVAPAGITTSFSMSGSVALLRAIKPANITYTNTVSGAVVKGGVKVVAPAGITFTNTVSGSVRTLHVVRPTTSITFTNTVSGSIRALRRIAPTTNTTFTNAVSGSIQKSVVRPATATSTFTNTVSGAVQKSVVRAVIATSTFTATMSGSVRVLHVVRPTTNITFTNTVTGAVTARKRVSAAITYTNTVSGNVTKPALFKPIAAATINASSTVSGKVTVLRAVRPTTNITFTNSVNGITQTLRRITPAQITFTNAVSGSIQKGFPRAVLPANITYTNTVSGVVVPLRGIRPASITFTNAVSGSVRVLRAVRPITNVTFTNTVSGGVTTLRRVTANITYTNSVNGIVRKLVAGITAQITFTNTVSGSVRTLHRVSATITFTNTVIGSLIHAGFVPVWPTQITFTNFVTGSIVARRGITTAQATFTNTVSGSIVKQTRLTFGTITYTNTVSGVVAPLRAIRPTSITYTNTVNGNIVVVRAIRLAGITATFSTTGRVTALRVIKPANITFLATIAGFVLTKGSTAIVTTNISYTNTVTGRVTALKQITTAQVTFTNAVSGRVSAIHTLAATITFTNSVSGYIQKGFTRAIVPTSAITFTVVMTSSAGSKRPILPAGITYTNSVTGLVSRIGTVFPATITYTNTVSGKAGARRYVVPTTITWTNTVTGTARRARGIFPATITYTNTVNGRVLRLAGIRPVAITFTVNTSGNIGKLVHLGALITWTNTVTATLHMAHRFGVIPIATGRTTQGTRGRAFATGNGNSTPAATRGRVFSQ